MWLSVPPDTIRRPAFSNAALALTAAVVLLLMFLALGTLMARWIGTPLHALATAATFAAGLQQAFRSDAMSKPLHAGHAAEAGAAPSGVQRTDARPTAQGGVQAPVLVLLEQPADQGEGGEMQHRLEGAKPEGLGHRRAVVAAPGETTASAAHPSAIPTKTDPKRTPYPASPPPRSATCVRASPTTTPPAANAPSAKFQRSRGASREPSSSSRSGRRS